jgi:hypothetical protein
VLAVATKPAPARTAQRVLVQSISASLIDAHNGRTGDDPKGCIGDVPRRTAAEAPAGAGYEADAPSQLIAAHRMNHYSTPSSLLARATPWLSSERPSANFVTDYFAIFLVT